MARAEERDRDRFAEQAAQLRAAIDNVTATIRDSEGMPRTNRARAIGDSLEQAMTVARQLVQEAAAGCP